MLSLKYWHVVHANSPADQIKAVWAIEGEPEHIAPEAVGAAADRAAVITAKYIAEYRKTKFEKVVEIDGVTYEYVYPPKAPIGWYADLSTLEEGKPEQLCAMLYHQKGYPYGAVDRHQNPLFPRSERAEIFREKFPLALFAHAIVEFTRGMEEIGKSLKLQKRTNGERASWEEVFRAVAKFYNVGFWDVIEWNVRTFFHLLNAANEITEKENERYRRKLRSST